MASEFALSSLFVKGRAARLAGLFLSLTAIFGVATPSFAQAPQAEAEKVVAKKKKQKPVSPLTRSSSPAAAGVAAGPAPGHSTGHNQALQAQNPLTPLYSVLNENDTNSG